MAEFSAALARGQVAESEIARWLQRRGHAVLPAYEKILDNGKGPRLFLEGEDVVVPDMQVFTADGRHVFVECKRKTGFSWYRNGQRWTTGVDLRHWHHYLRCADITHVQVALMFLQLDGQTKDSPPGAPTGLYYATLETLRKPENISHTSDRWGRSGMIYWAEATLTKLAEVGEVVVAAEA